MPSISPARGARVVVVTTRENSGSSRTSRSHSVLLPDPAGPAITSKTGTEPRLDALGTGSDIRAESIGERHDREQHAVTGECAAQRPAARRLRKQPREKIPEPPGLGTQPDRER